MLIGRYPVDGILGRGGFGVVFRGLDPHDGRPVAVKTLERSRIADPVTYSSLREQLAAEAGVMVALESRHCVRVRDVFDLPNLAAVVTDLVDGASLREVVRVLRDTDGQDGRLTGPQALGVTAGALLGLQDLHRVGLVHGDVKPDNVLVETGGRSLLNDFGLVAPPRLLSDGTGRRAPASGTPAYMAPEAIAGEQVDVRCDVYACAVMLFELLAGRRPFVGSSEEVVRAHLFSPAPDLREFLGDAGEQLARLCARNLAKDPDERHQSVGDFIVALRAAARESYGAAWGAAAGVGSLAGAAVAAWPGAAPLSALGGASAMGAGGVMSAGGSAGAGSMGAGSMGAGGAGAMGAGGAGSMGAGSAATLGVGAKLGIAAAAVVAVVGGGAIVIPLATGGNESDQRQDGAASEGGEPAAEATEVVEVYPYDEAGELAEGWSLDTRVADDYLTCSPSNWNAREAGEFYSCGSVADYAFSCWPTPGADDSVTCPTNLAQMTVTRIDGVSLDGEVSEPDDDPWPLIVELIDGSQWRVRIGGAWPGRADGAAGAYSCEVNCSSDPFVLLQPADEPAFVVEDGQWFTYQGELGEPDEEFPAPERVEIAAVWFAAPAP